MGYHYVSDKNKPFGPIYGFYKGKPTFTEILVSSNLFTNGKSWDQKLKPLPGYHIDHVDIWFGHTVILVTRCRITTSTPGTCRTQSTCITATIPLVRDPRSSNERPRQAA